MTKPQTTSNRQWMIDKVVFCAWGRFGSEVGWRTDQVILRLSKPDAIAFIKNNFRHVLQYGVLL